MKRIRISFEIITEESAERGDVDSCGWINQDGEEIQNVSDAIAFLMNEGAMEPSSSQFHTGIWYTHCGESDYRTGEVENRMYHLVCFTEAEEKEIFDCIYNKRI